MCVALDAIASDDIETFEQVMVTIHVEKKDLKSGDVVVRARKCLSLPNA